MKKSESARNIVNFLTEENVDTLDFYLLVQKLSCKKTNDFINIQEGLININICLIRVDELLEKSKSISKDQRSKLNTLLDNKKVIVDFMQVIVELTFEKDLLINTLFNLVRKDSIKE